MFDYTDYKDLIKKYEQMQLDSSTNIDFIQYLDEQIDFINKEASNIDSILDTFERNLIKVEIEVAKYIKENKIKKRS